MTTGVIAGGVAAGCSEIRTLGRFEVVAGGTPITQWQAGRARHLLQYLVTNANATISRTELVDAVWGHSPGRSPEVSLKVAVCVIRRLMAGDVAPLPFRLVSRPGGYALEVEDGVLDVLELERALDAAAALARADRFEEAESRYRACASLYRGHYLPDCHETWATIRRERLKDRVLAGLAAAARESARRGRGSAALELHERMLDIDPCREESYREVMRWHSASGQPSRARDWYVACAQQLRAHLDLEPSAETRRVLAEALHGSDAA